MRREGQEQSRVGDECERRGDVEAQAEGVVREVHAGGGGRRGAPAAVALLREPPPDVRLPPTQTLWWGEEREWPRVAVWGSGWQRTPKSSRQRLAAANSSGAGAV